MRKAILLGVMLLGGVVLGVACNTNTACTNAERGACDPDAGTGCAAHQSCIDTFDSVDPCPSGVAGCCFTTCAEDADCVNEDASCINGACAQGRCVDDAGS